MEARPPFLDHKLAEFAVTIPPEMRIRGSKEKYVLREAMKGVLPETLYTREKFAFMAPPAHTDVKKWNKLRSLLEQYASREKVEKAGLLDADYLELLIEKQESPNTDNSEKVQVDAILNHALGVMLLHHHFVERDIPAYAYEQAQSLNWVV